MIWLLGSAPVKVEIKQFFRPDGTLISIPEKLSKKLAVLRASELSPGTPRSNSTSSSPSTTLTTLHYADT
jgi:hypothetical protein